MKYLIELKKDGRLRGEILRATEEEAREIAREWTSRGCGNTADWRREEKLWIAVYRFGNLDCVVDDEAFDYMKETGVYREDSDSCEWALVRGGKFYETLSEAFSASMSEYGVR